MELLHKKNLIIAGPCSVESEEQIIQTAIALKETLEKAGTNISTTF